MDSKRSSDRKPPRAALWQHQTNRRHMFIELIVHLRSVHELSG
jgi:hypothetical protein